MFAKLDADVEKCGEFTPRVSVVFEAFRMFGVYLGKWRSQEEGDGKFGPTRGGTFPRTAIIILSKREEGVLDE